jgi:hypothetical protein
MGTGTKRNNTSPVDGESFQDAWSLTAAQAAPLSVLRLQDDLGEKALVWYNSTSAFSTYSASYGLMPLGTIIFDLNAHKTIEKTSIASSTVAAAYVASAARS